MGVSTDDLYGQAANGQPATPGSYGLAPSGFRLAEATRLGPVRLQVSSLERSLAFYREVLGMRVLSRHDGRAELGAYGADQVLVELNERAGARAAPRRGRLGLYHFAILLPDRAALGRLVKHLADIGARAGASDHLVSEALYLQDPDDLGIEVYADRPRHLWRRQGRELMISTDPLDLDAVVAAAGGEQWTGMPAGTVIGHVHLHVGSIEDAAAFFSDTLGFDRITWRYPGALFMGAGGYHHHLGTNVWAGPNAEAAREDEARLLEWTIIVPERAALDAAAESLAAAGRRAERNAHGDVLTADPWGTAIRMTMNAGT